MCPRHFLPTYIKGDQKTGNGHRKRYRAREVDSAELPLFRPTSISRQELLRTFEFPSDQKNGDKCEWTLDKKRPLGKRSVSHCNLSQGLETPTISNQSYHSNSHQLDHRYFFLLSMQRLQRFSMLRPRAEEPYLHQT